MKQYDYFLFDWDGTLAKSLHVWHEGLKKGIEKRGYPHRGSEIGANFSALEERLNQAGFADSEGIVAEAELWARDNTKLAGFYQGNLETLFLLKKSGKKLGLVTSSLHVWVDPLVKTHNLGSVFDVIVCGDDVKSLKPHPEPIERAIKALQAPLNKTVMIGDSSSDILSAQSAGIDSILFFPDDHDAFYDFKQLEILKPTNTISSFSQLVH